jgi:hypothetical protein
MPGDLLGLFVVDGNRLVPVAAYPPMTLGFEVARIRSDPRGRYLLVGGAEDRMVLVDVEKHEQARLPDGYYSSEGFEVTHHGRGLFRTASALSAYDLARAAIHDEL